MVTASVEFVEGGCAVSEDVKGELRDRRAAMVERSIAWLVRGGDRTVCDRGIPNNDLWLHHRLAGLNGR